MTTVKLKADEYVGTIAYWKAPDAYVCTTRCLDGTWTVGGHIHDVLLPAVRLDSAKEAREYAHAMIEIARKGV